MVPPTMQRNGGHFHSLPASASSNSLKLRHEHLEDDTLVEMFRRICADENLRSRIVLKHNNRQWTLGELDEITDDLARLFITSFYCKIGSCVAIYMQKCAEYVIAYIAALKAGGAYLPLDISYPESLLDSVLDEVNPVVVCTTKEHSGKLPAGTPSLIVDDFVNWIQQQQHCNNTTKSVKEENRRSLLEGQNAVSSSSSFSPPTFPFPPLLPVPLPGPKQLSPDNLAYVVYSSGTTGKPKGIKCPHRGAVISYKWRSINFPYEQDDVEACNVFFVWEMFRPILHAIPMVIIPDSAIYDPKALCNFLEENRVTRMLFTPSLLEMLLDTQDEVTLSRAFQRMKLVHLCGEVVTCALLERFIRHFPHVRCINLYSISECHDVSVADLNEFYARNEKRQFAPVGKVIEGVKILILDGNTMKRVPIGVPGEIYVAGPTLALGYINRPELNAERFVELPEEYRKELGEQRMYRTGDWGYLLPNLVLEICGRCDTTVRIRGYSVELQAIEAALLNLPHVRSCAVICIGEDGDNKQLAAYIVLRDKRLTRKQLRAQLKRVLPFYMMPQFFIFVDKLPLLAASSKIDRKALPPVDFARDVVEVEALPQTDSERALAQIWMQVLHLNGAIQQLDIQESFFDMGGHSLLAARLLTAVNNHFQSRLVMRDLFNAPTVYAMARMLDGAERVSPEQKVDLEQQVEAHDFKFNIMDLHLRAFWRATTEWKKRFHAANVFLTGVTGFLGSHLLSELLKESKTKITCLIRESSSSSPSSSSNDKSSVNKTVERRLVETLCKNGLWNELLEEEFHERVRVVAGDIALVQFGLNDEDYHFLSYDIDVVLHAAAYVNLIYPYQALHGCNVIGTRNIIEFCFKNKIKPLHYISTDAVFSSGLTEVDEDTPPSNFTENLADGYGQSKYVAEQLVLRARDRGLPSVIYRLGNQAAPTKGVHWNAQDFTYLLLVAILRMGATPNLGEQWEVELTPVDFTARFIVRILSELFCENAGRIFHLINGGEKGVPKWPHLMDWLRAMGFELKQTSLRDWIKMVEKFLSTSNEDLGIQQLQKLIQGGFFNDDALHFTQSRFNRANTEKVLAQLQWNYPSLNEPLLRDWIQRLIETRVVKRPLMDCQKLQQNYKMLDKRVCIVTGASEGIGAAICRALAVETGAFVVLASRQISLMEEAKKCFIEEFDLPAERFLPIKCDITKREEVQTLVQQTLQRFHKIDVLINCAGAMYYSMAYKGYTEEWQRQIDVNVHGTTNMIGAVLPHFVQQNAGHILTITSDAGKRAFPGLAVYSGTKFYLEGFISALRQELVGYAIRFTNVQPGDVATKLAGRSSDEEARQKYDASGAGHKILSADELAKTVLFALSQPSHVAINEILIEPQAAPI